MKKHYFTNIKPLLTPIKKYQNNNNRKNFYIIACRLYSSVVEHIVDNDGVAGSSPAKAMNSNAN